MYDDNFSLVVAVVALIMSVTLAVSYIWDIIQLRKSKKQNVHRYKVGGDVSLYEAVDDMIDDILDGRPYGDHEIEVEITLVEKGK